MTRARSSWGLLLGKLHLGLAKLFASLVHLLVEVGRVDGRHQLTLADVVADIDEAGLEIAVGARVDGCFREWSGGAGQHEATGVRAFGQLHHLHGWQGVALLLRLLVDLLYSLVARNPAEQEEENPGDDDTEDRPDEDAFAPRRVGMRRGGPEEVVGLGDGMRIVRRLGAPIVLVEVVRHHAGCPSPSCASSSISRE